MGKSNLANVTTQHCVTIKENLGNFPSYRWEVSCSCHWTAKVASQELATAYKNNHLIANDIDPTIPEKPYVPANVETQAEQVKEIQDATAGDAVRTTGAVTNTAPGFNPQDKTGNAGFKKLGT